MSESSQHGRTSAQPGYQPWQQPDGHGAVMAADGKPTAPGFTTATMGRRLGARLLDGLVLGIPAGLVFALLGGLTGASAQETGEPALAPLVLLVLSVYVLLPLVAIAYEVVLTSRGGTLGKRWLGLRVVQRGTGALPGTGPALLRWLIFFASSFVVLVGTVLVAISPFFDGSGLRQGWHDLVAGTRVVDVRRGSAGRSPVT